MPNGGNMFETRYRIVPATAAIFYHLEKKVWWWPFWFRVLEGSYSKRDLQDVIEHLKEKPIYA